MASRDRCVPGRGELALYVAYLDGWSARQRAWPWATALTGLAVSVAGNVGHIQAWPGHPVNLADRLTAAASPLAAFAGLSVGLLVVKMTRQRAAAQSRHPVLPAALALAAPPAPAAEGVGPPEDVSGPDLALPDPRVLRDARVLVHNASARGERLSQRGLARALRDQGHHFPNDQLRQIAESIELGAPRTAA